MKENLKECLRNFFIIVTLINIAMYVLGMFFAPEQKFGYEAFLYPLLYGALGSIPKLVLGEGKELTAKQFLIRETIGMMLCIAILLVFMFAGKPVTRELVVIALGVAASVMVIFVAVNGILWILDAKTAQCMTDDLRAFQEKIEKG